MADDKPTRDIPETELDMAFSGPAPLVNKFYVTGGPHGVRIAFVEQRGGKPPGAFRSAVVMTFQDAIQLRNVLTTAVAPVENELAKLPK